MYSEKKDIWIRTFNPKITPFRLAEVNVVGRIRYLTGLILDSLKKP